MRKLIRPAAAQDRGGAFEWVARILVVLLLIGLPLAIFLVGRDGALSNAQPVEIHAKMPEQGGWSVGSLSATVGQPLRLKLVSDDVVHSFKVGQRDEQAVELLPGKTVETSLVFDEPGKYTFYCTRWCGPNHWRMRGTIEVFPKPDMPDSKAKVAVPPLYVRFGLDIDAPHPAQVTPQSTPSVARGAELGVHLPQAYLGQAFYQTHSPIQAWEILREDPLTTPLGDQQVWDLIALIWASNTTPEALETGRALYTQNCAACHGAAGAGDGVFAVQSAAQDTGTELTMGGQGHNLQAPADFTDPAKLLGASPALLQGKIVRGGMGTGMPYWGPIFSEDQIWALVDTLYTFQFNLEANP